jgi:hypothetical protein
MTCLLRVISQPKKTHLHHPTANIRHGSVSTNKLHKPTENSMEKNKQKENKKSADI